MKKRKSPIVLISILVVMVGGAFIANSKTHQSEDPVADLATPKDSGKALGNGGIETKTPEQMQKETEDRLKLTAVDKGKSSVASMPEEQHRFKASLHDTDEPYRPMILQANNKPAGKAPAVKKDARKESAQTQGQWYH